jgi:serine/threonine protein phosphatase 1
VSTEKPARTFAIGDIHGDAEALYRLLACFPELGPEDTIVFVGDYVDRGPKSKDVIDYLRKLPSETKAQVVILRGNHEDAWLRVIDQGWPEFILPAGNGCLSTLRSYQGLPAPEEGELMGPDDVPLLVKGSFFPDDVVAWMRALPHFYENDHAIFVHAGLTRVGGQFLHPSEAKNPTALLWCRDDAFFRLYRGKLVVFGHTSTELLPPELSSYTPEDPTDIWAGPCTIGLDTGCGKGGWLTGLELPSLRVYESR